MEDIYVRIEECFFGVKEDNLQKDILKNINLKIGEQFVVITGPNGSGKSTLAKLIAGIQKPTSGQILFDGQDITDLSITDRANIGISLHFNSPFALRELPLRI